MKVTVNSLKDLYVSLGGQLTDTFEDIAGGVPVADYTTIPDVIEACSQIAGSTIELPAVSGADNGKVLKVIEGAWAKGTDESLPAVTAEDAGKILGVTEQGEWAPETAPTELPAVTSSDNGKALIVSNGAWGAGDIPTELPAVTGSDNGKVLKVANGAWGAGTDNELPDVNINNANEVLTVNSAYGNWDSRLLKIKRKSFVATADNGIATYDLQLDNNEFVAGLQFTAAYAYTDIELKIEQTYTISEGRGNVNIKVSRVDGTNLTNNINMLALIIMCSNNG